MNQKQTNSKWKCTVCENIFEKENPEKCPACNAPSFKLKQLGFKVKGEWEM